MIYFTYLVHFLAFIFSLFLFCKFVFFFEKLTGIFSCIYFKLTGKDLYEHERYF